MKLFTIAINYDKDVYSLNNINMYQPNFNICNESSFEFSEITTELNDCFNFYM